jgi:hypothetical protein
MDLRMLGIYDNFPQSIHYIGTYSAALSTRQLQQRLIQALKVVNRKPFSFEEIAIPTIPNGEVIFEFGLAEDNGFNFIDTEETKKALNTIKDRRLQTLDFFCAIRYYKVTAEKKVALKFDYYMIRTNYAVGTVEFQIHHKQGPRYISIEDLASLIVDKVNAVSSKKILKKTEPT